MSEQKPDNYDTDDFNEKVASVTRKWLANRLIEGYESEQKQVLENALHQGRIWAIGKATGGALDRISTYLAASYDREVSAQTIAHIALNAELAEPTHSELPDYLEFWRAVGYQSMPTDLTVEGFVEGAMAVWDEVAEQVCV